MYYLVSSLYNKEIESVAVCISFVTMALGYFFFK
jgi:hypothetical protein